MESATFYDYDAYAEALQSLDIDFMMQNLVKPIWHVDALEIPGGISIQHCSSGSGIVARGASTVGGAQLAIPEGGDFCANGARVSARGALLMTPGDEFVVTVTGAHRWFDVFIPDSLARPLGLFTGCERPEYQCTRTLRNQRPDATGPVALLCSMWSNLRDNPELGDSEASLRCFQAELLTAVGQAYGRCASVSTRHAGRAPTFDQSSILLAVDAIEASQQPLVALAELVRVTGVPERSLRAGFQKFLGLSPSRYMQLRTLNAAWRRLLRERPGEITVARVAADLGVWDLGRFAKRYRQLFGEPPSATLQRVNSG